MGITNGTILHVLMGLERVVDKYESELMAGNDEVHCYCLLSRFCNVYRYRVDAVPVQQAPTQQLRGSRVFSVFSLP